MTNDDCYTYKNSKYPGDPPGTCPNRNLYNCQSDGKVIGCTHHHPNYELLNNSMPSISIMREPISRAISAFFYPGIHHNSKCTMKVNEQHKCFLEYMNSYRWQNVAVKLMSGLYAYGNEPTCVEKSECPYSLRLALENLQYLAFMGVAEMWELSLLVLHLKLPNLQPLLEDFKLGQPSTKSNTRTNRDDNYKVFKVTAPSKYAPELKRQNQLDSELYVKVVENLCQDLHNLDVWKYPLVRRYWAEKSPHKTSLCP